MTVKMVVVDLDGTLLSSKDEVSAGNRTALEGAARLGVIPVIASGRSREESQFVLDRLPQVRYFMGMNGAKVEDLATGEVLIDKPMGQDDAAALIEKLDAAGIFFQIYAAGGVFCTPSSLAGLAESGMSPHYLAMFGESIKAWPIDEDKTPRVYKFIVVGDNAEKRSALKDIVAAYPGQQLVPSMPARHYYEILPQGIDKGGSLAVLCGELNISPGEVLAIGDSENDLSMLDFAGVAVAVAGAAESVKAAADYLAPSNDEDGVGKAIERFIFV